MMPIDIIKCTFLSLLTCLTISESKERKKSVSAIFGVNIGRIMSSNGHQTIDELNHEAYALVEQGICFDEVGDREGALRMYEQGLALIEQAGKMPDAANNVAYMKMTRARDHINYRLKDLRGGAAGMKSFFHINFHTVFILILQPSLIVQPGRTIRILIEILS
jgi:hypothetical protein